MNISRPKLNLKYAYERVKSALQGLTQTVDNLDPIAKNSAGNGAYNGKMTVNQKDLVLDAAAVSLASGIYPIDGWKSYRTVITGTIEWLSTNQPNSVKGSNSLKITATSTATGAVVMSQPKEHYAEIGSQTITISKWVKSNTSNAILNIYDGAWLASSSHSGNGEWELLSVTITLDGAQTQLQSRCGLESAAGANISITSGDYIEFTDVRLDLGEHRLSGDREYADELALCKRYFQTYTNLYINGANSPSATDEVLTPMLLPVPMRVNPTVSNFTSSSGTPAGSSVHSDKVRYMVVTAHTTGGFTVAFDLSAEL